MAAQSDKGSVLKESLSGIPSAACGIATSLLHNTQNPYSTPILKLLTLPEASKIRTQAIPHSAPRPLTEVITEAEEIFSYRMPMSHPHAFAFIPSPASPLSFLGDILTSAHNSHAGSWLQSSGPSTIEDALISFLASSAGLPASTAGGVFVSGGSMANLVCLTLARDQMLGKTWEARSKGVVYVSDQTHVSIAKGLRILGFEERQIIVVKSGEGFKMDVDGVREAIEADRRRGLTPFLIIASCGTTNTGSVDPLRELVKVAREQSPRLWVHVDGAYGASVVLSKSYKGIADGLGEADSISWDAHKWLFQTYGCGMALVRDRKWLMQSFAMGAEYTRDAADAGDEMPNFWNYGPELTRPARAMKLWFTLQVLGLDSLGKMIDQGFMLAEAAEKELKALPNWTIVSNAQMAIINFRFEPEGKSEDELDQLNSRISQKMVKDNVATALTTRLLGKTVIRICAIHPELMEDGMSSVIKSLNATARALLYTNE
ncbi:PLP-dependent transferase [Hyaloscypha variabilis F]|uniref:PLP-dependent transferase n=1 Tax=Hyaloscypha variabilis (strain UAMH 11265 / GT02V1 / F) TaxID=1149755 RepID=A0A2J6RR54_HYAVF|nr:PLP-dependent transferase [Hyaloscypha variabilis F]